MNTVPSSVDVDDVRARHPLTDVIAAHGVDLRRRGHGWVGCCPFHDDTTASLSVDGVPDRYHCFGCGASGDVIEFVRRTQDLSFLDAVAYLEHRPAAAPPLPARRPNLRLVRDTDTSTMKVERGLEINALAWRKLSAPVAAGFADSYLRHHRGIDLTALRAQHGGAPLVGYADPGWTSLTAWLTTRGVTADELVSMDLATPARHGGLVDTLRGRLVMPVTAEDGQVAGFIGRDITGNPATPKYRNPSRTPTFDKAALTYRPTRHPHAPDVRVVVVEGVLDALAVEAAAARCGLLPRVAACTASGVTVSDSQADTVLAISDNPPLLALDGDRAGAEGTDRWLRAVSLERHRPAFVLRLPAGLDPADWLADQGPAGLAAFLDPPWLAVRPAGNGTALPARALVRLTIDRAVDRRSDPVADAVDVIGSLSRRLGPAMATTLLARATSEMTRRGWNPNHAFETALRQQYVGDGLGTPETTRWRTHPAGTLPAGTEPATHQL